MKDLTNFSGKKIAAIEAHTHKIYGTTSCLTIKLEDGTEMYITDHKYGLDIRVNKPSTKQSKR